MQILQVTTTSRHLLVQLQVGQTAAGKPKLNNRSYPHVDVSAADAAIDNVLQALAPLYADPIYAMGRVDTVQIQSGSTAVPGTGTSSSGSSSGTSGTTSGGSTAPSGATTAGAGTATA